MFNNAEIEEHIDAAVTPEDEEHFVEQLRDTIGTTEEANDKKDEKNGHIPRKKFVRFDCIL